MPPDDGFMPSWGSGGRVTDSGVESDPADYGNAGNPFAKGETNPGKDDYDQQDQGNGEEEEAYVIAFLKKMGKTDDEVDQILGIARPEDARAKAPKGPEPMFPGDRMGK